MTATPITPAGERILIEDRECVFRDAQYTVGHITERWCYISDGNGNYCTTHGQWSPYQCDNAHWPDREAAIAFARSVAARTHAEPAREQGEAVAARILIDGIACEIVPAAHPGYEGKFWIRGWQGRVRMRLNRRKEWVRADNTIFTGDDCWHTEAAALAFARINADPAPLTTAIPQPDLTCGPMIDTGEPAREQDAPPAANPPAGERLAALADEIAFACAKVRGGDRYRDAILPILQREVAAARPNIKQPCEACWTNSWEPVPADDPDAQALADGTGHVRCLCCWLRSANATLTAELAEAKGENERLACREWALLEAIRAVYPAVAGRAVNLREAGEKEAAAQWCGYAQRLFDAGETEQTSGFHQQLTDAQDQIEALRGLLSEWADMRPALFHEARRSAALEAEVEGLARGWKQRARLMETWGELEAENQAIAMAGCGEELTNALRQIKERA